MTVIIITLLSTFSMQCGYLLWKMAAGSLPTIGKEKTLLVIKGFLTNVKWMVGYLAIFIGWILLIKAVDIGELSLVQPLVSVGDVFLVMMAVIFLKERLQLIEWFGLSLIVSGATALSFGVQDAVFVEINWQNVFVFLGVAMFVWVWLLMGRHAKGKKLEIQLALASGISFGVGGMLTKVMTLYLDAHGEQLESIHFVLNPVFPFVVIANVAGLYILQMAFQNGRASVIVPVQLAVLNGLSVVSGVLLFSEHVSLVRLCSVVVIICGTFILQKAGSKKQHSVLSQV